TSSYDVSVIGATSPLRWHAAHLSNTIGATSRVKVGTDAAAAGPAASAGADSERLPSRSAHTRFMVPPRINCGVRIANCGFSGLRNLRSAINPHSTLRTPQSIRNPQPAIRNTVAHFCPAHVGATIVTDVILRRFIGVDLMNNPFRITV